MPTGTGLEMLGDVLASPPSDVEEFNPVTVSPGLPGFIAMFVLAVGVVLLVLDMTRRVRRVQAKDRVETRMAEAERAEREAHGAEEQPGEDQADSAGTTADDRGSDSDHDDSGTDSQRDDPPVT